MNTNDYGKMVFQLFKDPTLILMELTPAKVNLNHAASGLAGEAAEVLDLIKKHVNTGAPLDLDKLFKEMGDVEFYMEALRQAVGVSRDNILDLNMRKLSGKGGRYEHGYSDEAAVNRVDTGKK